MKRKITLSLIIILIAYFLFIFELPSKANGLRIQSPKGMSQSAWEATAEYKAFQCPDGYGRGVGVDMNFTTDKSDDFYFVQCEKRDPIIITPPQPVIDTSTTQVSPKPITDTITATTNVVQQTTLSTQTYTEPVSVITETKTATIELTTNFSYEIDKTIWQEFLSWFQKWISWWFK